MFYCMYNGHADITAMISENGETAEKYYYDEWVKETETSKYGDITGDGKVTVSDYSLLKKHLYIEPLKLTSEQKKAADLNADGKVDTSDLNTLKQILFGEKKYCEADTNRDGFINEKNSIKYAGYYYDAETGLYYLNARFYDPETARFIQQDSYSGNIYDPLSLNLYTYSNNNPISYYDPTGHSVKSVFKKAVKSVKKAYNTAKAVVTAAKPIVKQTVTSTAKTVAKATYQNTVVKSAETVYKATKAASQNLENNSTALKESGWAGNIFANVSKGILDTVENTAGGFYNLANDPLGTVSESVNYFKEDPLRHNIAGSVWSYYQDISRASYVHDWDTVEQKLGSGLINLAGFAAVAGKTESAVKVKYPNGINKTIKIPKVVMADTGVGVSVPAIAIVSKPVTVPATVVAGAAGVANAAVAGQVVYSVAGGPKQSSGGESQFGSGNNTNSDLKVYPDGSIRDSKGHFAGKTGIIPGTPGVEKVKNMIETDPAYRGYIIRGEEISVRAENGALRRYDLVVEKPDGTISGIEVKSGTAVRTAQQRKIDNEL